MTRQDFNRRFTVPPTERGSALVKLAGLNLELVLSVQHERKVHSDSTVVFEKLLLRLPRCPVLVHEVRNGTLGVSYQGRLIARFNSSGDVLPLPSPVALVDSCSICRRCRLSPEGGTKQ